MLDQANFRLLRLEGELDLHTVRGLTGALSEAVGDTTHDPVVDLSKVTFMDSSALATLAKAAEQLRRQGRRLALVLPAGKVRRLLDLTGLLDRFEVLSELPGSAPAATPAPATGAGRFAR